MVRFLISVPDDLHKTLKSIAKPRGQTLNGLIRQILWEWMEAKQTRPSLTGGVRKTNGGNA